MSRCATGSHAHVRPEQRVQDVTRQVEGQVLLELVDRAELFALAGGGELLERGVGALHVRGVVLVVVQFEDLGGIVRLERRVVIGQVGQRVLGHRSSSGARARTNWSGHRRRTDLQTSFPGQGFRNLLVSARPLPAVGGAG